MMQQQVVPQRIAMVIKRDHPIGHIDMVSRKTLTRNDPLGVEPRKRSLSQEGSGKNGACPVLKEDAVW